ncbi:MAG: PIG-L family deacetylase [Bacteroidota bacterium]|nr:PIG-L family deacetylase [Rhodothermia bacterium]MCS7155090.1 PIG-L family deacetylase [Bacteroidota bacterium]MDW8138733.1 PIG-L family deacetylase [Bacteroidota bacterium]MDW8286068.1 PIG-L family deacetylase [Bacteroidota bacterium]
MVQHLWRLWPLFASFLGACTDPGDSPERRLAERAAREARVLMAVAAHPDDEDGFTLLYYRHRYGMRTYTVYLTRGEGGQNAIGPQLYEALGALRAQETARAAAILGTVPYFLNFRDFGYSKTAQETFALWGGRQAVVNRLVAAIRRFRPDVIITNHDTVTTGPSRQHGHHQAAALALWEALGRAADAGYAPELGPPWRVRRLFVRLWDPRQGFDVALPVFERDPVTGRTFAEGARQALRQHASQDMVRVADTLRIRYTYYRLLWSADGSRPNNDDLFWGIRRDLSPAERRELENKRILARLGTRLWVQPEDSIVSPGQTTRLRFFAQRLTIPNPVLRLYCEGRELGRWPVPASGRLEVTLRVPADAPLTYPLERYQYGWPDPVYYPLRYVIRPAVPTEALPEEISGPIPVLIAAPVVLRAEAWQWLAEPNPQLRLMLEVAHWRGQAPRLTIQRIPEGDTLGVWIRDPLGPGRRREVRIGLRRWRPLEGEHRFRIWASGSPETLSVTGRYYRLSLPAQVRVGWIPGLEPGTEGGLRALGARYEVLDSATLARGDLRRYTAILIGVRAYYHRADLGRYNGRLLEYIRQGGHVVVLYQRPPEWNGLSWPPYPIRISTRRVSREDAPVRLLRSDHPLLRHPYRLDASIWRGWVQERGLYFPDTYAAAYEELLEMADPDEAPLRGGLLVAAYGRGSYLYTSLAWYRQWELYHPGALRALANMLAYPLYRQAQAEGR